MQNIPLSLYIHFPWCVRKCPYCDFNSHVASDVIPETDYIAALIQDLQQHVSVLTQRPLHSIFLGGGTPSLFSPKALSPLFDAIDALSPLSNIAEITLEANPGTRDSHHFRGYRDVGINRLSIGIQSFNDDQLKRLGRIHNSHDAIAAIDLAKATGFDNINLDLMYGLPDQSIKAACHDLATAIDQGPSHISWYQLTLEPNTVFYTKPPPNRPNDDTLWKMEVAGKQYLADNGYAAYEISAYAKQEKTCRHNLNYWRFGDYLGIGAGAHSKVTDPDGRLIRFQTHRMPKDYLNPNKPFRINQRSLAPEERAFEFFLNHWRLLEPTPICRLLTHTGINMATLTPQLAEAEALGLIRYDANTIQVTAHGHRYLNDLLSLFLPDQA